MNAAAVRTMAAVTSGADAQGQITLVEEPEQWKSLIADGLPLVWVDIEGSEGARELLETHFNFHPLAVDDALAQRHVPRVDDWDDYLYLVIADLLVDAQSNEVNSHEIDVFVGQNYLVTLHDHPCRPLDEVWSACLVRPASAVKGPDHVLYLLMDRVIEKYFSTMDTLDTRIDDVQDSVFDDPDRSTLQSFFGLKRALLEVRRVLTPTREVLGTMARDTFSQIDPEDRIYFRDLFDHLVRLVDINETLRDLVTGGMDAYLSVISNKLNEIMKTLTVVTVLFMPLSFITGFFGMNFFGASLEVDMPGASSALLVFTMAAMLAVPGLMALWLRRRGWL